MKKGLFKVFGAFFVLLMMTGLTIDHALAEDSVSYLEWTGSGFEAKTVSQYTVVTSSTSTWSAGTYVVTGKVTIQSRITVSNNSTVKLILCDGAELTVNGLTVSGSASLSIFGQNGGSGKLISVGAKGADQNNNNNAEPGMTGINAVGSVTLYGGQIYATGGVGGNSNYSGNETTSGFKQGGTGGAGIHSNGNFTFFGGKLLATGGAGGRGSQNITPPGSNGIPGNAVFGNFTIGNSITVQADGGSESIYQPGTYKGTWTSIILEYIAPHAHTWSITIDSSNVSTATVRCSSSKCPYENSNGYTATIQTSEQSKVYDGQPVTANVTKSKGFPDEITVSEITYTGREGTAYESSSTAPEGAGDYTASISIRYAGLSEDENQTVTAYVDYTIEKADIDPDIVLENWIYGSPNSPVISGNTGDGTVTCIYYVGNDDSTLTTAENSGAGTEGGLPVNVGTYFLKAEVAATDNYLSGTATASFSISKASMSSLPDSLKPTAKGNLTYDGTPQNLLSAPTGTVPAGYTLQYSAGDSDWSTEIPTGQDAGEYSVRYQYAGDANHCDYPAEGSLTIGNIKIAQKEVSLNWSQTELTYNGGLQVPTATAGELCGSDECSVTVTGAASNAGTHTATAASLSNDNYQLPAVVTREFTISPLAVSAPTIALEFTEAEYTGSALEPAILSVKNGSTVIDPEEYSVTYYYNTDAGTALVTITNKDGGNYNVSGSATFLITKAPPTVTAPTGVSETYSGQPVQMGIDGATSDGTMRYGLTPASATEAPSSWSDQIPSATEANEYKLWYYVKADDNHEDSDPTFVQTKILPKTIIVSGITAVSKVYDGTASATLNYAGIDWTACGRAGDDDLSVTAIGTFSQADAETDLDVTINNITLTGASAGNYALDASGSQKNAKADILKAASSVKTAPMANNLTANGAAHPLVTAGEASGGKMLYALGADDQEAPEDELFTEEIPTRADEGVYHVWYKCKGDLNHTDTTAECISVTVNTPLLVPEPEPDPEPLQEPDPGSDPEPQSDPEPHQEPDPGSDPQPNSPPDPETGGENPNPNSDSETESQQEQPSEQPASPPEQETPAQPQSEPQQEQPSEQPASPPGQETPAQPQSEPEQEQPSEQPASPPGQETPAQPEQESPPEPEQELPSEQPASPTEQETPTQPDPVPQSEPEQELPSEQPASPSGQETPALPDSQSQPEPQMPVEQPVSPPVQETSPEPESLLPEDPVVPQPELVEVPTLPEPSSESEQLPAAVPVFGGKYSIDEGKKTAVYTGPEDATASSVTIPAAVSVDGVSYPVTEIQAKAFQGMTELKQITIGKNVTVIGKNAFSECRALNNITFKGKKVVTIGDSAFRKCVSLSEVTIPASVKMIGKKAFEGCRKLKTVTIKTKKLTSVGKKAFKGISTDAQFKCPKKQLASYTEMIRKAGAPKNAEYMKQ